MCNRHSQRDSSTLIYTTKGATCQDAHAYTSTNKVNTLEKILWRGHVEPHNDLPRPSHSHRTCIQEPDHHTDAHTLFPCTGTTSRMHTSELCSPVHTKAPSSDCSVAGGRAQPEHTRFHSQPYTNQTKANRAQASHPNMGRFLDDH